MSEARHAAILRWLALAEPDEITVSCREAPLQGAVVLDRCLTEVPLTWLAELAVHCPVRAAVDHCTRPEAARARISELAALTPRVMLDGEPGEGQQTHYASPPARRRGLFGLGSTEPGPSGTLAQRLAAALAQLPTVESAPSNAARLRVTDACTACAVCVRSCPQGALELTVDGNVATLSHTLDLCQGDEACVSLCPEEAIVREGTHLWSEIHERPASELATLQVRACDTCRTLFSASTDTKQRLCRVCEIKSSDPFGVHLTPAAQALLDQRRRTLNR